MKYLFPINGMEKPTANRTIVWNSKVIGTVTKVEIEQQAEVAFWIDKPYWGKGNSVIGLELLLAIEPKRPLYGHVAFDNCGSQKVLERCGFVKIGTEKGYANARQAEIEEWVYQLENGCI
jgi:ribosomal-protein-alanine N-acetyltransferase